MATIENLSQALKAEKVKLYAFKKGKSKLILTHRPYLQEPWGGLLPKSCIVIGGHSSAGKSYELETIMTDVFNTELNPDAGEFVWLNFSLEMPLFSLMLRKLSRAMGISKKDILLEDWSDAKMAEMKPYLDDWMDGRYYIIDKSITAQDYFNIVDKFCTDNKSKKAIFISIDHLVLMDADGNTTSSIASVLRHTNTLKLKHENVFFIYLSQVSPGFFSRVSDRDNRSFPREGDFFYSSQLAQVSDYSVVIIVPEYLGCEYWLNVVPDKYPYLEKYLVEPDKHGKCTFYTEGLLFYHLVKNREADRGFDNLFVHELYKRPEQVVNKEVYISKKVDDEWKKIVNKNALTIEDDIPF